MSPSIALPPNYSCPLRHIVNDLADWTNITTPPSSYRVCYQVPISCHLCYCSGPLNSFRCCANHVNDAFRLGEHRHVAAVEFIGGCAHDEAVQLRVRKCSVDVSISFRSV